MKDSLEEISGANSEFEGKIIKPILLEDWASMFSKLRSLLMSDAYKLEDFDIRQQELQSVRAMPITSQDIFRSLGRDEIFIEFFWSALKLNKWAKEDMKEWLVNLEIDEEKGINKQQDLMTLIMDLSIPKPKAGEPAGNP
jgi:hypothetical protein